MNKMNGKQFLEYIMENFNVSPEYVRLAENVIHFAETLEKNEQHSFLYQMFDMTIGLTDDEIESVCL